MQRHSTRSSKTHRTSRAGSHVHSGKVTARKSAPVSYVYATAKNAATTAKQTTDWLASKTWRTLSQAISRLESGSSLTGRLVKDWNNVNLNEVFKQWAGWATRLNPTELMHMAQSHKHTWERDLNSLANNVVRTIKHTSENLIPNSEELMKEAKRNISNVYCTFKHSALMHQAAALANISKEEILSLLNIPSQKEVENLQRKVLTLEQRMTTVMLRGAKNR